MKRCPKCGSGAEFINRLKYYGNQTTGVGAGVAAACGVKFFAKSPTASVIGKEVYENITKGVHKKFRCTNPRCNYQWEED